MKNNKNSMRSIRSVCSLSALMGSLMAHAQTPPTIGDVMRQVPAQSPVTRPSATLPGIGGVALEPPLQQLPQGGATVQIQNIMLVGNRMIDADELLEQIPDVLGKSHTLAELEAIASKLTRYYRTQGYFVARVYVPAQTIKDGELTLRVVEGGYGQFTLQNKSLVKDDVLQVVLDDIKKYDIVSTDTLERAMLIINDTPGARVTRADIMPGEKVGTSDFVVGTTATAQQQGYVLMDNHGSRYTGKNRLSFNLDVNSPNGEGDRLSLSGLGSTNGRMLNARAAYSILLSPNGWRGELSAVQTTYSLGDAYRGLDALGLAHGYDLNLTYPIRRTRNQTIELGLSYSQRELKDQVRFTGTETLKSSQSQSAQLSIRDERAWLEMDGVTQGALKITQGSLHIRDAQSLSLDSAIGGAATEGLFTKLNASLSRTMLLPENFTLSGSVRRQYARAGKNLDGSERMAIAGANAVMGYPMGEASGTDATLAGLELSRPLPSVLGLQHQWQLFTNAGRARTLKQSDLRDIRDVGLGWSATTNNGLMVKAYWAHRVKDQAVSEPDQSNRFLIQAGWVF